MTMASMSSILRSIAHRSSPSIMFHPRLIGLTPATTRGIGSLTSLQDIEEDMKKCSDKQAKVVATIVLQGFEASELKTLLPLVLQHFSSVEADKIVKEHLASVQEENRYGFRTNFEVSFEGFEKAELEALVPCAEQHLVVPDVNKTPKNLKASMAFAKSTNLCSK